MSVSGGAIRHFSLYISFGNDSKREVIGYLTSNVLVLEVLLMRDIITEIVT
jgi:hypothetical protein